MSQAELSIYDDEPWDFLELDALGAFHFNLLDAALLLAINASEERYYRLSTGEVSESRTGWAVSDAPDVFDDPDTQSFRSGITPLVDKFVAALTSAAKSGQLVVEVKARSWPASELVVGRTYVSIDELIRWASLHGFVEGDYFAGMREDITEQAVKLSTSLALSRMDFRMPKIQPSGARTGDDDLRSELLEARKKVAALEAKLADTQRTPHSVEGLSKRRERSMLTIIGALARKCGIDYKERGAARLISEATSEQGATVGEETVLSVLRGIRDAVESRSRQ